MHPSYSIGYLNGYWIEFIFKGARHGAQLQLTLSRRVGRHAASSLFIPPCIKQLLWRSAARSAKTGAVLTATRGPMYGPTRCYFEERERVMTFSEREEVPS